MSLITSPIPSLANGISQQPAVARLSSQGEVQENGQSSIVEGLGKRPPTHHIAKMIPEAEVPSGAFLHLINRDTTERYSVIVSNGAIRVFDLDGDEKTVNNTADDDYLDAADDETAFRAVTVADYTFLVNREKTVEMAARGTDYTLTVNASHNTGTYKIEIGATPEDAQGAETAAVTATVVANSNTAATLATQINTAIFTALSNSNVFFTTSVTNNVVTVRSSNGIRRSFRLSAFFTAPAVDTDLTITSTNTPLRGDLGIGFVRQGNYATNYSITVAGTLTNSNTFSVTAFYVTSNTDPSTIATDFIASTLKNTFASNSTINSAFTVAVGGSVLSFTPNSTVASWTLSAADSNGNRNLVAVKEELQKFTDLPNAAPMNFTTKIIGDTSAEEDDFYVRMVNTARTGIGVGTWEETVAPDIQIELAGWTMPHLLVREADGTFTFKRGTWDNRPAGDETSNPDPSIVGTTINDIVFFRNRLGFLADENVCMSAAGPNYFRFFRATVQSVLDGDPIDVAASNVTVSILRNAVPFSQDKMLLFSDQKQFIFTGGDLLTPKTASIKPSTSYEALIDCKPVAAGKAVYFPTPRGDNSGLREYTTDATTAVDDAEDVTAHVPAYIPANVFKIAACPNEDQLFLLTRDEPTSIFLYKYYFVEGNKLQASWSKWTSAGTILDANFIETTCYLAIQREDGIYLESVGIEAFRNDENMDYEVLLDRRFLAGPGGTVTGTYSAATKLTTFALPYETSETVQAVVRDNGAIPAGYYESQFLPVTKVAGNTSITIPGDVSAVPLVIGIQYTMLYTFSEIVFRQASGQGGERPVTGGRLQVRRLDITFDRTGYFRVTVTPTYGDTYTYHLTPKILGQYITGSLELQAGELKVPVMAKSDEVIISIINDSPYPSRFLNAAWLGEFVRLGRSA